MKIMFRMLALSLVMMACSSQPDQATLKENIKKCEAEVQDLSERGVKPILMNEGREKLVNSLLAYYRTYPEDAYAAECLGKVHMSYSAMNEEELSIAYADTLIQKYPDYPDRMIMLESLVSAYELRTPRNTEKIKEYLQMLIKEFGDEMSEEKRADMEYHLKFVDLSLEQRIEMNQRELN